MVNKWHGVGNLGKDPEMKYSNDGMAIAKFSIAITEKVKGEKQTEWVRIVAFSKLAEICDEYLSKGKQVYVEGKLHTNKWEDKEGNTRYTTEIIASNMQMLGSKGDVSEGGNVPDPDLGDVPF
jgi:single-strand DNA-binding protein